METAQHGLTAIRYLRAMANGKGENEVAIAFAEQQKSWGSFDRDIIVSRLKSSIGGIDLTDIQGGSQVAHDLLAALRPLSIVGRLQNLRRIPARVPLLTQLTGSVAGWRGNGQHRRLSAGTYARENLPLLSVGALSVANDELLRDGSFEGEAELLRDLLAACAEALDMAFIDPANTGIAGATPASITGGAVPIYVAGGSIADLDVKIATAIAALIAAGSNLSSASWVMSPVLAAGLSLARGSSGALAYPGMGANGGQLIGLPALTSASCTPDSDGYNLALVDASQVSYVEDAPSLSVSRNASIEMSDAPTGDATTPTAATILVSMFQSDCAALLASMACNWKLRRPGCVQLIAGIPATLTAGA